MNARLLTLVGAIGVVAVLALGWFVGVSPMLTARQTAVTNLESTEMQNASLEQQAAALQAQFEQIDDRRAELTVLQSELPETPSTDTFLESLQTLAGEAGVSVDSATFGAPELYATTGQTLDGAASGVVSMSVSLSVTGELADLLTFLDRAQQGARVFLVNGTSFAVSDGGAPTLSVTGYVYAMSDAVAAQAAAGATTDGATTEGATTDGGATTDTTTDGDAVS